MHSWQRRFALVVVLLGGATFALAQQPKKPGVPPKKPPKPALDAGSEESPYGSGDVSKDGGAPASSATVDAGAGPVATPLGMQSTGDGGIRPSPLNPTPEEMPTGKTDGGAGTNAVDYDKLIADIAALRARVSAVGDSMFRSRVVLSIETDNDHAKIARLAISLDDGVVYTAKQNFRADDSTQIYAAGVAAGRHAITVDVDRADERNDAFKTSQRTRFLVDVPRDQELVVQIKITDDSNMGKDFPGDQSGRYELKVRMDAKARAPGKK